MTEKQYPGLPQKHLDALLDHVYEHGTTSEGVLKRVESMLHSYADADRAMRAAEPVAVAWEVVNKEIGYRAIFATETQAKCVADQHDEAGYSQAAILPLCYATPATQPAPQPQEASAFQGKVTRHSDQSVLVTFPSSRLASEFERSLEAEKATTAHPPGGWVMVPREPTEEMIAHAYQACDGTYAGDVYRAMLAVAPKEAKIELQVWRSTDSCGEFWSWDECDQYDYDRAKPEDRRIICIVSENV